MRSSQLPHGIPVLSAGRHWSPRRGACFMEFASVLAGERWSDHPHCTHECLAELARLVNDAMTDPGRQSLTELVPAVIGRHGDHTTSLTLAVRVAAAEIAEVPESTQRVLAAGLLRAEQLGAQSGPGSARVAAEARAALDRVPGAVAWVRELGVRQTISLRTFERQSAPTMIRCVVNGIRAQGGPEMDRRLRALLELGIASVPTQAPVETTAETAAGAPTGERIVKRVFERMFD